MKGLFALPFCMVLSSCIAKKNIRKVTITRQTFNHISHETSCPPITLWIHGTKFVRRPLYQSFFGGKPCLRLAKELASDYYLHSVAHTLNKAAPDKYPLDTLYLFGWSGKLSPSVRQHAAQVLYEELKRVTQDYKKIYGKPPYIQLLTHSHGGTVALNLVRCKEAPSPFTINELILMACPVQNATKKFIEDDLFSYTCALYSSLDMVQVLAPQISYNICKRGKKELRSRIHWPLFSERCFELHPRLAQVKLKMNGRSLFHTEFASTHFLAVLPQILHVIKTIYDSRIVPNESQLLCVYTPTIKTPSEWGLLDS